MRKIDKIGGMYAMLTSQEGYLALTAVEKVNLPYCCTSWFTRLMSSLWQEVHTMFPDGLLFLLMLHNLRNMVTESSFINIDFSPVQVNLIPCGTMFAGRSILT